MEGLLAVGCWLFGCWKRQCTRATQFQILFARGKLIVY